MNFSTVHHFSKCIRQAVPFCIVIALAVALKRYYSLAEADSLVWILAPTARCVELVSGIPFTFESGTGFTNLDHRAAIAPACAGINFMIIAFCMMVFCLINRSKRIGTRLLIIIACLLVAYCFTIGINALRIALAVNLYDADVRFGWFTQERIHRLVGTVIYFTSLCSIYAILKHLFCATKPVRGRDLQSREAVTPAAMGRHFCAPAVWYLAVTLALPLVLGKYAVYKGQLLEHVLFVLVIPAMVILFFSLYRSIPAVLHKKARRKGPVRS
jgi:exosortase K